MSRLAAKITGVAGYVPPRLLTNADLEKMVDTTDEWIMERVGIRERIWPIKEWPRATWPWKR